jgi:hypothetical protein
VPSFKKTLVVALSVFVGACSKGESEAVKQTPDAVPAAAARNAPPIGDVCALVTKDEAEGVLGKSLADPQRQTSGDCWYLSQGGTDFGDVEFILSIIPVQVGSEKEFDELVASEAQRMNDNLKKSGVGAVASFSAEKATGVGAPAYFIDPGLYVLKGTRILAVGLGGDKGVALAKIAYGRMP